MNSKKSKPFINVDFKQLYPHFNPIGFKRIFRMLTIKKIFKK